MNIDPAQLLERAGGLGLCLLILWGAYRLIDKMSTRWANVADGFAATNTANATAAASRDKEMVAQLAVINSTMTQVLQSQQRSEAQAINAAETSRFLQDIQKQTVENLARVVQYMNTLRAEQVFRDETVGEIHTMSADIHREVVKRDTGVHRMNKILEKSKEREDR